MGEPGWVSGDGPARGIVLVGFMGAGKSSVGPLLARRLGLPFVDLDQEVERLAGRSIPEIFQAGGEAAFRALEARAVRALSAGVARVIATGGGVVEDPSNRAHLQRLGTVVWLFADLAASLERASRDGMSRPLLAEGSQGGQGIEERWRRRRWLYATAPVWVETRGLTPEGVAEQIPDALAWLDGPVTPVAWVLGGPQRASPIFCADGLLGPDRAPQLARWLQRAGAGGRALVVADRALSRQGLASRLAQALSACGMGAWACEVGPGERAKRLAAVAGLYAEALRGGLDRSGTVVALGGGACLDAAGFFASTYMRGVPWVAAPTTLLAQVDASVGGKTAINLPPAKNLVGTFHPPALVLADTRTLDTLPARELRCGLAEVVKHGLVGDPGLLAELVARFDTEGRPLSGPALMERMEPDLVGRAARIKAVVVSEDLTERGVRAILNFGHTTAHALEALSGFRMRHGEAVAIGLVTALLLSRQVGLLRDDGLIQQVVGLLRRMGLPVRSRVQLAPEALWEVMAYDKKARGGTRRWVLLAGPGQPVIAGGEVSFELFAEVWKRQARLGRGAEEDSRS